ncbi:ATP-dependent zinc metalloprotease FTSH 10 [Diplonema papillatum]|nr:ATP-dependent zinc metalloprotease FTSH 10 [Diplonema papillatum]
MMRKASQPLSFAARRGGRRPFSPWAPTRGAAAAAAPQAASAPAGSEALGTTSERERLVRAHVEILIGFRDFVREVAEAPRALARGLRNKRRGRDDKPKADDDEAGTQQQQQQQQQVNASGDGAKKAGSGGPEGDPNNNNNNNNNNSEGGFWAARPQAVLLLSATGVLLWWLIWSNRTSRPDKEISWQVFRDTLLPTKQVKKVKVITGNKRAAVKVYLPDVGYAYWFTVSSAKSFEAALAEAEETLGIKPSESLTVEYDDRIELGDLAPMLGWALSVAVLVQYARLVMVKPEMRQMMTSQKDKFKPVFGSKTKFKDVAGMKEAKREIQEFVDFMKHPERFTKLGAKVPSGAILFGPPGTGKTLLAKAVAGESGVPFYSVCGADFVEMYVGVGAARVRELFKSAKQHERAIIYIDEIDAVGRKRGGSLFTGGSSERENTLNQLLIEMDGFKKTEGKIIVLASTNVSPSSLDEALLRPGRLDRQVYIDRPTVKEREEIFQTHLDTINLVPSTGYVNKLIESEETMAQADDEKRAMLGLPPIERPEPKKDAPDDEDAAEEGATVNAATDGKETDDGKDAKKDPKPDEAAAAATAAATAAAVAAEAGPDRAGEKGTAKAARPEQLKSLGGRKHRLKKVVAGDPGAGEEAFSKAILPNSKFVKDKVAQRMAQLSPGFVGADIANICNEGALIAAREKKAFVDLYCMEKAIDRVIGGIEKRSRVMSEREKKAVAYHEAGHAVVGWFLEHCDPLMKISIVPRGSAALGYAQYLPSEKQMQTFQQLFDQICMTLGGRASELYHFNHLSTGAQDDLSKVTRLAYSSVATFGMARQKLSSVVSYPAPGTSETNISKPYSEEVAQTIDEEVKTLVDKAFKRTMDLIAERNKEIEIIAQHLLKNEVITRQDFIDLIGPRPFAEDELPPPLEEFAAKA